MPKIIPISGHIGFDVWPEEIRAQLNASNGEDVVFEISSGGGFISDGLEIFNLIHDYQGNTTARIIGMAASMASYIRLAADKVIAKSNTVFMIHGALTGIYGNEEDHREAADILAGLTNLIADIYVKKTGKPAAEINALLKKDSFFFGKEMLEFGFVDEIEEIEIPSTAEDKANLLLAAKANIQLGIEKMLVNQDNARANMTRAAAVLAATADPPKPAKVPVKSTPTQDKIMNWAEMIETPEGKTQLAALLKAERKTGATEGTETAQAKFDEKITKITNILESKTYPDKVKAVALKALKGDLTMDTFDAALAMFDMSNESDNSDAADDEQADDTPPNGEQPAASAPGKIANQDDMNTEKALFAKMKGKKKEEAA